MMSVFILGFVCLLGMFAVTFGMLRGLAFYGVPNVPATPTAATIFDPILGAAVTKIPQAGKHGKVAIRGCTYTYDTPSENNYALIRIGQEGDYHEFVVPSRGDADAQDNLGIAAFIPMGDFEASENDDLAIYLVAEANAGQAAGVLWYDDLEPETEIPKGRIVTLLYPNGGADAAVAYAAYGTIKNKLSTKSIYYIIGCHVMPEDEVVQCIGLHSSDEGLCAMGPNKGLLWFPSCPLVIDGNATIVQKAQVSAVTEIDTVWFAVEVPKREAPPQSGTSVVATLKPFTGIPLQAGPAKDPRAGSYFSAIAGAIRRT